MNDKTPRVAFAMTLLVTLVVFAVSIAPHLAVPAWADEVVQSGGDYTATEWDEDASPDYVRVAGQAIVLHADVPRDDAIHYGSLDNLGRATWAAGYITPDLWETESYQGRESNALPDPVGLKDNAKATIQGTGSNKDYKGYFYNRSHLIADSLGGDPILENLVTGTRCQNVGNSDNKGGMAYTESAIRDYMKAHQDHTVYYAATPVYVGNELVPRSVYVDVETQDGSINQHVEVYNVAKGFYVDYVTGGWGQGDPNLTRTAASFGMPIATTPIVNDAQQSAAGPTSEQAADMGSGESQGSAQDASGVNAEGDSETEDANQGAESIASNYQPGKEVSFDWMVRFGIVALVSGVTLILIAVFCKLKGPHAHGDEHRTLNGRDSDEEDYEDDDYEDDDQE